MQSKELPRFPGHEKFDADTRFSFGYDPKSNDYKLLRLTCRYSPTSSVAPVLLLQVYSSNADSWKEIHVHDTSPLRGLCYPRLRLGGVTNGAMYTCREKHIFSFDLHSEVCTVVPVPSSMKICTAVFDFEGSAAVTLGPIDRASGSSLWTLDIDVGGKASWTKIFDLDKFSRMWCYVGGGLLCGTKQDDCETRLYDYKRKKDLTSLPLPVKDLQKVLRHTETLASIQGFRPNRCEFGDYKSCSILG